MRHESLGAAAEPNRRRAGRESPRGRCSRTPFGARERVLLVATRPRSQPFARFYPGTLWTDRRHPSRATIAGLSRKRTRQVSEEAVSKLLASLDACFEGSAPWASLVDVAVACREARGFKLDVSF